MNQQIDNTPSLARRILAILPTPVWNLLRKARRSILNTRSRADVFSRIAEKNEWDGTESVSGPGSTMAATQVLRAALPALLEKYEVQSLLDVPCGDAYWISDALSADITYTGGDIVPALIEKATAERSDLGTFVVMDLVTDDLPRVDLVIVRDCFIHLPHAMVKQAIANVKRSGSQYLLTTTYPGRAENIDIEIGGFRPVDLQAAPYSLPEPLQVILETEGATSGSGKSIALWDVSKL